MAGRLFALYRPASIMQHSCTEFPHFRKLKLLSIELSAAHYSGSLGFKNFCALKPLDASHIIFEMPLACPLGSKLKRGRL